MQCALPQSDLMVDPLTFCAGHREELDTDSSSNTDCNGVEENDSVLADKRKRCKRSVQESIET